MTATLRPMPAAIWSVYGFRPRAIAYSFSVLTDAWAAEIRAGRMK